MTQYDQLIDRLIDLAIEEDIATGDVTTNSIIPAHSRAVAEMKMKADGVISGLAIAKRVEREIAVIQIKECPKHHSIRQD